MVIVKEPNFMLFCWSCFFDRHTARIDAGQRALDTGPFLDADAGPRVLDADAGQRALHADTGQHAGCRAARAGCRCRAARAGGRGRAARPGCRTTHAGPRALDAGPRALDAVPTALDAGTIWQHMQGHIGAFWDDIAKNNAGASQHAGL